MNSSLVVRTTSREVAAAVSALRSAVARRNLREFAVIDHAASAREAGLQMPEETVVVFGNPKVGTSVMLADPVAGLDLPLRVLVYDDSGTTKLAYHDPRLLAENYALDRVGDTIKAFSTLLEALTDEAAG